MKPLVQKIYKQILHPFLKEVEKATTDDGGGNEYLNAVEQAYVAVQVIEKRLEAYPLGDLDLHSLTADLFPELNNGSNAEYIDKEMANVEKLFDEARQSAITYAKESMMTDDAPAAKPVKGGRGEDDQAVRYLSVLKLNSAASTMFSKMIECTKQALTRSLKLSTDNDRMENSQKIAFFLMDELQNFLKPCLDLAEKSIPVGKQKSANEFTYFDIVTNVSAVMRLMRTEFEPHIYSHLEDYYQLRSDVLYRIKTFKEWLEQQLESGLNKAFDGMTARIKIEMEKQHDGYAAMLKGAALDVEVSPYMEAFQRVISEQKRFIMNTLSARAQFDYLRTYGTRLYVEFVHYFQGFEIANGAEGAGLGLQADLKGLLETVKAFDVTVVTKKFEILVNVAFMVQAENAQSLIDKLQSEQMNEIPMDFLLPFIQNLKHYKTGQYEKALKEARLL